MVKKKSVSSQQEKQRLVKNGDITLSENLMQQLHELKNINSKPDSDAPEIEDCSSIEIRKFYRPIKQQITLRLDADTLFWFKQQSDKYQTLINQACREYMSKHQHNL